MRSDIALGFSASCVINACLPRNVPMEIQSSATVAPQCQTATDRMCLELMRSSLRTIIGELRLVGALRFELRTPSSRRAVSR
jgi:hypothetical protein